MWLNPQKKGSFSFVMGPKPIKPSMIAVDDDEFVLQFFRDFFSDKFENSLITPETQEALDFLRKTRTPTILISDLQREGDPYFGLKLLETAITERHPVCFAALMSTSFQSNAGNFPLLEGRFRALGIPYFELEKPIRIHSLYRLIDQTLH